MSEAATGTAFCQEMFHCMLSRDVALPKGLRCRGDIELLVGFDFLWRFYESKGNS